jgi:hypothetical protein
MHLGEKMKTIGELDGKQGGKHSGKLLRYGLFAFVERRGISQLNPE